MTITLPMLFLSLGVGVIFVLIWGILVHIASDGTEFKSLFLGGFANFVFFVGGLLAAYFSQFLPGVAGSPSNAPGSLARSAANWVSIPVMIYVASATMAAMLVLNLTSNGFTDALDRMESLGTLVLSKEGYRDVQIYVGGIIGILCFIAALVSGLFAGAIFPGATFLNVACGVAISLGTQGGLYLIFGIFLGHQVSQIFTVSAPGVLGTYGAAVKRLVSFGITGITILFLAISWSGLFWLSIRLGALIRNLPIFR